jgi:hypothetical protein
VLADEHSDALSDFHERSAGKQTRLKCDQPTGVATVEIEPRPFQVFFTLYRQ